MAVAKILWVDDEIESLESQKRFLQSKGYEVITVANGFDAIDYVKEYPVDAVLMDETMPGLTGLETLAKIKSIHNALPVVLITKNETENLMDDAIGSQISDYLIKPVNPNQVWLSLKKIFDNKRLVSEKTTSAYQQEFRNLFMALNSNPNERDWMDIYRKLIYWELEITKAGSSEMQEVLQTQLEEANNEFFKFIAKHYAQWLKAGFANPPVMSHTLLSEKVFPFLQKGRPLYFILIDNLRLDQWKVIQPMLAEMFRVAEEETFYSILPTATQYSRNAIFSGLLPSDIRRLFPDEWRHDHEEGGKNMFEEKFLKANLERAGKKDIKVSYHKILNLQAGLDLVNGIHNLNNYDLNVIVYNFVDLMSHARTDIQVLKELAKDERSYRSLTSSWFEHSPLLQMLRKLAEKPATVVLSTDHGSIRVRKPVKVVGDRETTTNVRYKHGRNLNYDPKEVLAFRDPSEIGLPAPNVNSSFIFARDNDFLCYPNNYNQFVSYYRDSFQHGGISLEEMIVPVIRLESRF
jgi:DNA-binding response OmpR family regulator